MHPGHRIETAQALEVKYPMSPDRRTFLKTAALAGAACLVSGVPLVAYVIAPALEKGTGRWVDLGPVGDLKPGGVGMLSYEFMVKDGWLVMPQRGFVWAALDGGDQLHVFSSTCTHLGCNVIWREDENSFICPCHTGRFDREGRNVSGPPPKPLARLEHKIEDGKLLVFMTA
jgi:Rieske Fe-S protein